MSSSLDLDSIQPLDSTRTVEDRLIEELRQLIFDGQLKPGLRLPYRELAERFKVSMTPVRLAIRQLAFEGLVQIRPSGGAEVTPLSIDEAEEIFARRAGLEGLLAHRGAPQLSDENLVRMGEKRAALLEAIDRGDRDQYLNLLWPYRSICYEAAGRPDLLAEVDRLYRWGRRYYTLVLHGEDRMIEAKEIIDRFWYACQARDGKSAQAVVREMCDWSSAFVSERLAQVFAETQPEG